MTIKAILKMFAVAAVPASISAPATAQPAFGPWSSPVNAEDLAGSSHEVNSAFGDGCPILDPYSNDLFIASTRPGGYGGLDIWRASWNGEGWDEPVNLPAPINTVADEFCPTPARGNRLFFVSKRDDPNGDIYVARRLKGDLGTVERLPSPINSPAQEWSPSYVDGDMGDEYLYFSSTRAGGQDIYVSKNFGAVAAVDELNTPYADARPNVRRDGLEIVFDTDRATSGAPDIWTSSRASLDAPWAAPTPIDVINSSAGESRASLSWDGKTLVFGSARPGGNGGSDVYISTREKNPK